MRYVQYVHTKFETLRNSLFVKHILIVATGTAAAQAIGFLASPVISRLYTPEQFGGFAIFTTLTSLIVTISALGYESAVVLPKSDHSSASIVALSSIFSLMFFVVLSIAAFAAGDHLWRLLKVSTNDQWYFNFLPLVVLVNALANVLILWNNRKLLYKVNSFYRVSLSLGLAVLSIAFGYYYNPLNGLILAFLITNIFFSLLFVLYTWKNSLSGKVVIDKQEIITQGRVHSQFPKYYLVQNFFDSFRENVFVFIINSFFSIAVLGGYSFALRIIRVPLTLISSSVSQVAFQKISALRNENGNVLGFLYKLIAILFLISIPLALIFVFFGRELFLFVFGSQWAQAGDYTKLISIWLFCSFISSPVSTVPLIFGKAKFSFYYSIGFNLLSTLLFYFCSVQTGDFELSLLITSVSSGLFLLFYVYQIIGLVKKEYL